MAYAFMPWFPGRCTFLPQFLNYLYKSVSHVVIGRLMP